MRTLTDENANRNDDDHLESRNHRPDHDCRMNESRWEPPNSSQRNSQGENQGAPRNRRASHKFAAEEPCQGERMHGLKATAWKSGHHGCPRCSKTASPKRIVARKLLEALEPTQVQDQILDLFFCAPRALRPFGFEHTQLFWQCYPTLIKSFHHLYARSMS